MVIITHIHTHLQACIHTARTLKMKCKRQREGGGVQGDAEKKMKCSLKKKKEKRKLSRKPEKKENVRQKSGICKFGVREFRRRMEV